MGKSLARLAMDQSGVTAIEYGAIAALISLAIMSAVSAAGTHLSRVDLTIVFRIIGMALKS